MNSKSNKDYAGWMIMGALAALVVIGLVAFGVWTYYNLSGNPPEGQVADRSIHPNETPRKSSVQERYDSLGPWTTVPILGGNEVPPADGVVWIKGDGTVLHSSSELNTTNPWQPNDPPIFRNHSRFPQDNVLMQFETIDGVKAVVQLNQPFILDSDSDVAYRFATSESIETVRLQ